MIVTIIIITFVLVIIHVIVSIITVIIIELWFMLLFPTIWDFRTESLCGCALGRPGSFLRAFSKLAAWGVGLMQGPFGACYTTVNRNPKIALVMV